MGATRALLTHKRNDGSLVYFNDRGLAERFTDLAEYTLMEPTLHKSIGYLYTPYAFMIGCLYRYLPVFDRPPI